MTKQYIIKEKDWKTVLDKAAFKEEDWVYINKITDAIYSHPYNPQAERKNAYQQILENPALDTIKQAEREKLLKELCDSCQFSDSEGIPDESCFDCVVGVKWIALRQEGKVEK